MDNLKSKIKQLVEENHANVVAIRRHIHMHPELSFEEHQTADYIQEQLLAMGVTDLRRMANTGIVARLGNPNGKTKYLRADIDALPIKEANSVSYCSQNDGVMHACGHDVHTATLLGAIQVLKQLESELKYDVRCVFQPGEEKLPGGASILIKEGLFEQHDDGSMLGNHVHPILESGKVGFRAGRYMASADELYLTIEGRGGHGALPHTTIDPVVVMAEMVMSLQTIVSRSANPIIPSVLTFGKVNTDGGTTNVIPSKIYLEGTLRTFDEEWRAECKRLIQKRVEHIAQAHGATAHLEIRHGYPCLWNDEALTRTSIAKAKNYLGDDNVVELPIRATAEDFAFYSQQIPSCFYRIGTASADGRFTSSVHTPTFDIDESALLTSVGLMAYLTLG